VCEVEEIMKSGARRPVLAMWLPFAFALAMCASRPAAPPAIGEMPRLLVVTATAGFYHDSIPAAREVIGQLAAESGLSVTFVDTQELLQAIPPEAFAVYAAVAFVNTTGELPLSAAQKDALLAFVEQGGGFLGTHSATDTLYTWPAYEGLVGAQFKEHPWTQRGRVLVEDPSHPLMAGVDPRYELLEEYYIFTSDPRARAQILVNLDGSSVGAPTEYALAWCRVQGQGRVYYHALGHFPETWRDPWFQQQLRNALAWTAFRNGSC
jgi:uncharacterized protein